MTQRTRKTGRRSWQRWLGLPALVASMGILALVWRHHGLWWSPPQAVAQGVVQAAPEAAAPPIETEWDPEWNVPAVAAARVPSVAEQLHRLQQVAPQAFGARPSAPPMAAAVDEAVAGAMDNLTAQRERVLAALDDDPPLVDLPVALNGPARMDSTERHPDSLAQPPQPAVPPKPSLAAAASRAELPPPITDPDLHRAPGQ